MVELTPSEQCQIVEALRTDSSVRQIWEPLSFNRKTISLRPPRGKMSKDTIMKKIAVLVVFIFSYTYVAPLKAEKNEIVDARIAAETDAQADAASDARGDINQFFCCLGSSTLVTISAIGGAFLGCWLGEGLDLPQLFIFADTGMVCGCLAGWGIALTGSIYGIYKLGGTVPSERLLGKSPEYIEVYTAIYKREIGRQRAIRAAGGSAILHALLFIWLE